MGCEERLGLDALRLSFVFHLLLWALVPSALPPSLYPKSIGVPAYFAKSWSSCWISRPIQQVGQVDRWVVAQLAFQGSAEVSLDETVYIYCQPSA